MLNYDPNPPHIIKYMGSKKGILEFVIEGISDTYNEDATICDLFAGSSILSGALRNEVPIISNDIQAYSSVLANAYLTSYEWGLNPGILDQIIEEAERRVIEFKHTFPELIFDYSQPMTLTEFNNLENAQKLLLKYDFADQGYHLFAKNFSGTYWSYEQCVWIDALRAVADDYRNTPYFYAILASLMFAMSYNSQSTGHYAQYRDAYDEKSMNDILIYRQKEILPYFIRKFEEFQETLGINELNHQVVTMDYLDCLNIIPPNTVVYADPPYCFVHYSRFYHAIETLVRYDYPKVMYKGRYRTDRHQSPFCIRTQVEDAFLSMFNKIRERQANLVLSYSNTGMIELDRLLELSREVFNGDYDVEVRYQDHQHSTMGRKEDKSRDVKECLILAKRHINRPGE